MSPPIDAFAIRHRLAIIFITFAVCLGGVFSISKMPSSVFPETEFPRCEIVIENGVMPADEMMSTITRPMEEAMKDIPGVEHVRSTTGRGSADIDVVFGWDANMIQSELFIQNRLSQLKGTLPVTVSTAVWRLTFNAFPVIGVSLTSPQRSLTELWETARYDLKPRFLTVPGVARVDLVGGREPEYHVIADPVKLAAAGIALSDITTALESNNLVASAGLHSENYTLYLALVDSRVKNEDDLLNFVITTRDGHPIHIRDVAQVERGAATAFNVVTAQGRDAVLLNVRAQPAGSNLLNIAHDLREQITELRDTLPADMELTYFYDQSLLVKESVASVREAILIGLLFAIVVLFLFLKNWGSVVTAVVVIPVSVLATVVVMLGAKMTFNLMTLGGIAAAIGLIIDDAIVVVEAISARISQGEARGQAIQQAMQDILRPLIGSTLTPVVVFLPLAFLDGLPGVFFRALALTMVVALVASLVLAVTLTPALASLFLRDRLSAINADGGFILQPVGRFFAHALKLALHWRWLTLLGCICLGFVGWRLAEKVPSDFMPEMDEGGFVIDYVTPWGTSLEETDRMMRAAEDILRATPEVESYSRRTGAALGLHIVEPNTGDFLVKLRPNRERETEVVKAELRDEFNAHLPAVEWEFPGIVGDLVGDLTESPSPVEIKLYGTDNEWLKQTATEVAELLEHVDGVVDVNNGLIYIGPTVSFRVRSIEAQRLGLSSANIATALNSAMLGTTASSVLEGDRVVEVRVIAEPSYLASLDQIKNLPLQTPSGVVVKVSQVAEVSIQSGQMELERDDLRQVVAVTAALEGRDLGSAITEIKAKLAENPKLRPGVMEFGGLFKQQQQSFHNLLVVLILAIALVFTVLIIEFRSFREPIAIVFGSLLALTGTVGALWLTGVSLNIVSFLGAIIGVGIVAKNGILMLDLVGHHLEAGESMEDALVNSARRRLRPILMTSLATVLAMLPLAYGIGHGSDMLRPLAVGIIGALCVSIVFSLIATPVVYRLLGRSGKS